MALVGVQDLGAPVDSITCFLVGSAGSLPSESGLPVYLGSWGAWMGTPPSADLLGV